jgi:hypothetical protein
LGVRIVTVGGGERAMMRAHASRWRPAIGRQGPISIKRCLAIFGALLAVLPTATDADPIVNPSFESGLTGWTVNTVGPFTPTVDDIEFGFLPSDGRVSARIYSHAGQMFGVGQFGSLSQVVDLTDITSIVFDAALCRGGYYPQEIWDRTFEAAFLIDGVDRWAANSPPTFPHDYLGIEIDTSGLSGLHTLEFQNRAVRFDAGEQHSYWFKVDNVLAIPEPSTVLLVGLGLIGLAGRRGRAH